MLTEEEKNLTNAINNVLQECTGEQVLDIVRLGRNIHAKYLEKEDKVVDREDVLYIAIYSLFAATICGAIDEPTQH